MVYVTIKFFNAVIFYNETCNNGSVIKELLTQQKLIVFRFLGLHLIILLLLSANILTDFSGVSQRV